MDLIKISNDPILGFVRKVNVLDFNWSLETMSIRLGLRIHFFEVDEITEIKNIRVQPYGALLIANNTTNVGTEEEPVGEYDYFIGLYLSNPVVLSTVITGIILQKDSEGRFDN